MTIEKTWNAGEVVSLAVDLQGESVAIIADTIDGEGVLGPLEYLEFPASMLPGLITQLLDAQAAGEPKEKEAF